jgi:phosphoglucosamine mutase
MSTERKFFGTDGVRGPYGGLVVNEAFFARLACAAGRWALAQPLDKKKSRGESPEARAEAHMANKTVFVGRDTRESGEALARAAIAGLRAAGLEPVDLGVLPTPAVALVVRNNEAVLGVVITASHNPAGDNGIKFFKRGGLKLSDEEEAQLEAQLPGEVSQESKMENMGEIEPYQFSDHEGVITEYISAMRQVLSAGALAGWHMVLDTANGATCATSWMVLTDLGAQLTQIGERGEINAGCGSEYPGMICDWVREHGARLGVAHDGDGDRCVLCDERGEVLDGDEILTILALHALRAGRLGADTLVVTVQSNLGVDAALAAAGGRVVRTPVGDRHVAEKMRELGATLGGESSGHIICADVSPTGDGLVAALRVMEVMRATGRPLSELRGWLKKFPQASTTIAIAAGAPKPGLATMPALAAAIRALEAELGARGRVLARWSGTEPKLRLLVEGPDDAAVRDGLARLAAAARGDLGV